MKLLLDTCVWGKALADIIEAGHDAVWSGDWKEDPGDERILQIALEQDRILVTLDKDFGELAVLRGLPHGGIIRLVDLGARSQARACLEILSRYPEELRDGAIITVERTRVRVRPSRNT